MQGRARFAAGLLACLTPYFRVQHLCDEWALCVELAADAARRDGDSLAEGFAVKSAVLLEITRSGYGMAIELADPMCREHSQVSYGLASVYIGLGRTGEAERLLTGTLEVLRAGDDRPGIISCLTRLAQLLPEQAARAAVEEAMGLAEAMGAPECRALAHRAWSGLAERFGPWEDSIEHMRLAVELFQAIGSVPALADAQARLARLRSRR